MGAVVNLLLDFRLRHFPDFSSSRWCYVAINVAYIAIVRAFLKCSSTQNMQVSKFVLVCSCEYVLVQQTETLR